MSATTSAATPAPTPLLLAAGIVSAPEYLERRVGSRESWLKWPNVCRSGCALTVRFVVRAGGALPAAVDWLLAQEERAHGDMLRVDVPWNETRLRGPVLSVAAWFAHAVVRFASATFLAKMDDDAYVHTPGLEALLRQVRAAAPSAERVYLGPMSWFHWFPRIFERSGFGWTCTCLEHAPHACTHMCIAHAYGMCMAWMQVDVHDVVGARPELPQRKHGRGAVPGPRVRAVHVCTCASLMCMACVWRVRAVRGALPLRVGLPDGVCMLSMR